MKKIMCGVLCLLILLFFTSCKILPGKNENLLTGNKNDQKNETPSINTDLHNDHAADSKNIIGGTSFSDRVALIQYQKDDNYICAAIDTKGKTLFEFENVKLVDSCFSGGILVAGNEIYDKKGQVIASSEKTGYDEIVDILDTPKNIDGHVILYDYNGTIITDLSEYNIMSAQSNHGKGIYYENGYLLCRVENKTGSRYLCLIDKKGQTAFNPIKMESGDDFFPLDETGFVWEKADENNYNNRTFIHYNYTGNTTEYQDVADFYGFNDGLALVKNKAGQYYYINVSGETIVK